MDQTAKNNQENRMAAEEAFQTAEQYVKRIKVAGEIPEQEILNVIKVYTAAQTLGSVDAAVVLVGLYNDLLYTDTYSNYASAMDASTRVSLKKFMRLSCETAFTAKRYDLQVVMHYAGLCATTDKRKAWEIIDEAIAAGAPAGKYTAVMLTADGTLPDRYGVPRLKQMLEEIKNDYSQELFSSLSKLLYLHIDSRKRADDMFAQAEKYREQVSVNDEIPAGKWEAVFRKYEDAYTAGSVDAAAEIIELGVGYLEHLNPSNTGRWENVIRLLKKCGETCYGSGRYDVVTSYAGLYVYGMGDYIPKNAGKAWSLIDEAIAHDSVEGKVAALVYVCSGALPDRKGNAWLQQMLRDAEAAYPDDDFSEYHAKLAELEQQQNERQKRMGQKYPSHGVTNGYTGNSASSDSNSNAERLNQLRKELDNYSPVPVIVTVLLAFLGLHRVLAGKYLSFVFFFITFGGCGIWLIIDLVSILSGNWEDMNGRIISGRRGRIKREIAALERSAG